MTTPNGRPIEILLAEDNQGDIVLTREALSEAKVQNRLHVAEDGVEAMAFLRKQAPYETSPTPDLILLDLNMPRMNGHEVLAELKADDKLKMIPVVVLTTSAAEQDIVESYRAQAASYITKPVDFEQFMSVIRTIEDFWLCVVKLPRTD